MAAKPAPRWDGADAPCGSQQRPPCSPYLQRVPLLTAWQREAPAPPAISSSRSSQEMFHKLSKPSKTTPRPFLEPICPFGHPTATNPSVFGKRQALSSPLLALNPSEMEISALPFRPPTAAIPAAAEEKLEAGPSRDGKLREQRPEPVLAARLSGVVLPPLRASTAGLWAAGIHLAAAKPA